MSYMPGYTPPRTREFAQQRGIQLPPAQGGGFGAPQQPQQLNAPSGMINPVSPGMPGTQGSGSMDTGGLDANPGGGFGMPSPSPMPPVTNNYNTSRPFNNRTNQMFDQRKSTTNIDNSMTQQGQRMQRKTKAQLNPFQTISPEMDQKMIGDPSNPLAQLRIMRGR